MERAFEVNLIKSLIDRKFKAQIVEQSRESRSLRKGAIKK
jgi:hypothetical protein